MTSKEDILRAFGVDTAYLLHDAFMSSEPFSTAITQTGTVNIRMSDTVLSTGILSQSTARLNYTYALFNPLLSTVYIRERLSSIADVFAYFGFVETIEDPTLTMTQSHAGIFVSNGVVYWSTGNGATLSPNYKNVPITQFDLTRDIIVEQKGAQMRFYPLPIVQDVFGIPQAKSELRKWSNSYGTGTIIPKDTTHYFMWYIKNTTGVAKLGYIKNFAICEEHRD